MRYAVISDIHANRQALEAVLIDAGAVGVDGIICLGDVVGYGPEPAEVLQIVHAKVDHILLGNHDAAVSGRLDPVNFNPNARRLVEWTATQIDGKARRFLGALPAVLAGDGFRCAHAELAMPRRYGYIIEAEDAIASWEACSEPLLFVGHSHQPGLFVTGKSGRAYAIDAQDFQVEHGKRYIVNVGSVGQPRDGDVRASYAIYEQDAGTVYFRRIPFDVNGYRATLDQRGLPEESSPFLADAATGGERIVREELDFHPLSQEEAEKSGRATVTCLERAESRARHWRLTGITLGLLALLSCGLAAAIHHRFRPSHITVAGSSHSDFSVLTRQAADRTLRLPAAGRGLVGPDNPLDKWQVRLPRSGAVAVSAESFREEKDDGPSRQGFRLKSEQLEPFELRSSRFAVQPGMRFAVQGRFRPRNWQGGNIEMVLIFESAGGAERTLMVKQPPGLDAPDDNWGRVSSRTMSQTNTLESEGFVRYVLRGQFRGIVDVCDTRLILKGQ